MKVSVVPYMEYQFIFQFDELDPNRDRICLFSAVVVKPNADNEDLIPYLNDHMNTENCQLSNAIAKCLELIPVFDMHP